MSEMKTKPGWVEIGERLVAAHQPRGQYAKAIALEQGVELVKGGLRRTQAAEKEEVTFCQLRLQRLRSLH